MPGLKPRPLEERFWVKVAIPLREDGSLLPDSRKCWLWIGAKCGGRPHSGEPYGTIFTGPGKMQRKAHVVSFFLKTGAWPTLDVCHKCDTPLCVNPEHLFEASHRENMRDYAIKYGRIAVSKRPAPPRPKLPFADEPVGGVIETSIEESDEPPF